jgi:hypothetical protein
MGIDRRDPARETQRQRKEEFEDCAHISDRRQEKAKGENGMESWERKT